MENSPPETVAATFPWLLVTHFRSNEDDELNQVDEDAAQNQAEEQPDEDADQNQANDEHLDEDDDRNPANDEHHDEDDDKDQSESDEGEDEKQPFLIGDQGDVIKNIPELVSKEIMDYCDGWLLLYDYYDDEYSIFNPITSQSVQFSALNLKPEQAIGFSILSSSPANPNSMLILFEMNATSFIFCRIGDNQWTEEPARGEVDYKDDDGDYLTSPVRCKGKLYCLTHNSDKIVEIGLIMQYRFIINLLPVKLPQYFEGYNLDRCSRMTEYSGQLVMIYMGLRWIPTEVHLEPNAVEVYRLDFSRMEWEILDSAKDAALFFSDRSRFSCAAVGSQIEGSNVYFFKEKFCFYSFNLEDKRLHVSLPYSNLPPSRFYLTCVMPDFRKDDLDGGIKEMKLETRDVLKHVEIKEENVAEIEGNFGKLSSDILSVIARRLILHDYTSFRAVNRTCRLVAPPVQWTSTSWDEFEFYDLLPPWLMFCQKRVCNFIDPLRRTKYSMNIHDVSSKYFRILNSKDGWCVMLHGENSIFFWNSFSKKIIRLPDMLHRCDSVVSCCFSCSPNSSNCVLILVRTGGEGDFDIEFISLDDGEWLTLVVVTNGELVLQDNNTPVFFDGNFYFLGMHGNLGVFKDLEFFEVLDNLHCPCESLYQSHLLECKGELLSVFVGPFAEWVRIFNLDSSKMAWIELEHLGDQTLYLSHFSSFSMTATSPDMANRIYFPRFSGKNIMYYSLDSKKFQSHGTEDVFRGFYNTNEQLQSCWVELKWR
ncbi:hypothetical protein SLA2020_486560 [Shorea laevis]